VLSASETSLFSLSTFTINVYKHNIDPKKKLIAKLLKSPRDILVTILMLNIFSNILIQNTVSSLFGGFASWLLKIGVPLALTLFLGEIIPKSIALPNNKFVSYRVAPFIYFVSRIIKPLRLILTKITSHISRLMFFFLKKEKPLSIEELRCVIEKSEEKQILNPDETDLIKGYLKLHDSIIKEHMKPRDDILFYNINAPLEELIYLFYNKKYTRLPVCRDKLDNLLGIISLKEFFTYRNKIVINKDLLTYLKKPFFAVESQKAWPLLFQLRQMKENMAIVVDEYGSISGIITQEDLTEQVLGKISDIKQQKLKYTPLASENEIIASGKMEIEDLENIFNIKLKKKSNAVTLSGYLTDEVGDIPLVGTKIKIDNLFFYVLAADPTKITRVYVRLMSKKKK